MKIMDSIRNWFVERANHVHIPQKIKGSRITLLAVAALAAIAYAFNKKFTSQDVNTQPNPPVDNTERELPPDYEEGPPPAYAGPPSCQQPEALAPVNLPAIPEALKGMLPRFMSYITAAMAHNKRIGGAFSRVDVFFSQEGQFIGCDHSVPSSASSVAEPAFARKKKETDSRLTLLIKSHFVQENQIPVVQWRKREDFSVMHLEHLDKDGEIIQNAEALLGILNEIAVRAKEFAQGAEEVAPGQPYPWVGCFEMAADSYLIQNGIVNRD